MKYACMAGISLFLPLVFVCYLLDTYVHDRRMDSCASLSQNISRGIRDGLYRLSDPSDPLKYALLDSKNVLKGDKCVYYAEYTNGDNTIQLIEDSFTGIMVDNCVTRSGGTQLSESECDDLNRDGKQSFGTI